MERVLSKSQPLDQYDIRGILKHNHVLQLERIDSQDFFSKLDLHKILLYAYKDVQLFLTVHTRSVEGSNPPFAIKNKVF